MNLKDVTCDDIAFLKHKAMLIRKDIIEMIHSAQSGHPGGSLSAVEIVTALYFFVMNIDPQNPNWETRDRFILSKGHACPVLYAALADRGYFDKRHLATLRRYHSILQGHPDMNKTPGVDMTTGSLGNGLSIGVGMALSSILKNQRYNVYVLLGDGEIQEGMVWEAAMSAAQYNLHNLVAIIDYNGLQINGRVNDIMRIEPLADKWKSFGWYVVEIDGHDIEEILSAFGKANEARSPVVIIANTVKGKGVSFMENDPEWHGRVPNEKEEICAVTEVLKKGMR
jgi:transketolase